MVDRSNDHNAINCITNYNYCYNYIKTDLCLFDQNGIVLVGPSCNIDGRLFVSISQYSHNAGVTP